jgi:hypothetical protein
MLEVVKVWWGRGGDISANKQDAGEKCCCLFEKQGLAYFGTYDWEMMAFRQFRFSLSTVCVELPPNLHSRELRKVHTRTRPCTDFMGATRCCLGKSHSLYGTEDFAWHQPLRFGQHIYIKVLCSYIFINGRASQVVPFFDVFWLNSVIISSSMDVYVAHIQFSFF